MLIVLVVKMRLCHFVKLIVEEGEIVHQYKTKQ